MRLESIAAGWLLGLWAGFACSAVHQPWVSLLGAAATLCVGTSRWATQPRSRSQGTLTLALFSCAAGFSCALCPPAPPPPLPAGLARVRAFVERTRILDDGHHESELVVRAGHLLESGTALAAGSRLRVGPAPLPAGTTVRALLVVRPVVRFRNPSPHPPWPRMHRIHGHGRLPGAAAHRVLHRDPLWAPLGRLRAGLRHALHHSLPAVHAALACALLLGDRRGIAFDLQDAVGTAGLAHVLAVSGLHISLLAGLWVALLRTALLITPFLQQRLDAGRVACGAGIPAALALGLFCGGSPSALRAAVTAAIALAVRAGGHRPRATATAALAVLVLSAADPRLALRPGFMLSILATAAILRAGLGDPALGRTGQRQGALWTSLRVSWATTLATAPVSLWCFGRMPLVGLLSNLLGVPLLGFGLLPLALAHGMAAVALAPLAGASGALFGLAADSFEGLVRACAGLSPDLRWPVPDRVQGILLASLSAAGLTVRRARTWAYLGACLALGWALAEWRLRATEQPRGQLRATFLDVGQGDALWLDMPDGRLVLIDAGGDPVGTRDPGREVLLPLLRARRRERIDVAVLTHPHPDHYGGLWALADEIPITELWDSGQAWAERDITSTAKAGAKLLDALRSRGTRIRTPEQLCGSARRFGRAKLQVLWPCPAHDTALNENNNSLALLLEIHRVRWLLTGDLEQAAEARLLQIHPLGLVDVLKVGHHGSRTSSTAPLLQAIRPRLSIISRGLGNRFGHPHPEVLARLQRAGTRVLDLAHTGGVVVTTDGSTSEVRTWSGRNLHLRARASRRDQATLRAGRGAAPSSSAAAGP